MCTNEIKMDFPDIDKEELIRYIYESVSEKLKELNGHDGERDV